MDNFRSPKVVKLEQEIQALKAHIDELQENLKESHIEIMAFRSTIFARHRWINASKKLLAKTPQQSLDTLKAEIENETVERCKNKVAEFYGKGAGSMAINDMPRKYSGNKQ